MRPRISNAVAIEKPARKHALVAEIGSAASLNNEIARGRRLLVAGGEMARIASSTPHLVMRARWRAYVEPQSALGRLGGMAWRHVARRHLDGGEIASARALGNHRRFWRHEVAQSNRGGSTSRYSRRARKASSRA